MKKNWIIFIIIAIAAYGWMLTDHAKRQREYETNVEKYEVDKAEYEKALAIKEQEQEAKRLEILKLRDGTLSIDESTDTVPGEDTGLPVDGKLPEVPAGDKADEQSNRIVPSISPRPTVTNQKQLLELLGDPYEANTHVVDTDLYTVEISELGAKPIRWEIKSSAYVQNSQFSEDGATTTTMRLIPQVGDRSTRDYPLELVGSSFRDFNGVLFDAEMSSFDGGQILLFTAERDGVELRKSYTFHNDSYLADLKVELVNKSNLRKRIGGDQGFGIGWQGGFGRPEVADRVHGRVTAIYASEGDIVSRTLKKASDSYDVSVPIDWAGQEKKYFTVMIVPSEPVSTMRMQRAKLMAAEYNIDGVAMPLSVELLHNSEELAENGTLTRNYQVYVGPKNREALRDSPWASEEIATSPQTLVFHSIPLGMGFLRSLALLLLSYMNFLHDFLGMWGLAIIGTTITVRILILPLTQWAIRNQAKTMVEQERIRPELQAITKKYKNDAMKKHEAMMNLYREHEINPVMGPLRGCLPMLLQMPIFLALYVLFDQAVELRGQSFLWINDLTAPDNFFHWGVHVPLIGSALNILPIIMGFTNFFMMKMMQTPAQDEMQERIQKQMLYMMPVMMVVFLYHMPAGLTLYWTISNVFSIGQSFYTKRLMETHKEKHKAKIANKVSNSEVTVDAKSSSVR